MNWASIRMVVNTGDALLDLAAAGVGLAWGASSCWIMLDPRSGKLVELRAGTACETSAIQAVSPYSAR